MPELMNATLVYTRADLRRLQAGNGPARLRVDRAAEAEAATTIPVRSRSGRYLYQPTQPLPLPPVPRHPRALAPQREVG